MIKKGYGYYDIYNYRNSRYFIETVKEARRYEKDTNSDLVIFAGACQSYFEAIIASRSKFCFVTCSNFNRYIRPFDCS